ncbi:MAG: adenine phosphoribosyltransferase [Lachnospiraceae bacterium]|nr:adenine phosphoribosyltransferase [Lachnospiraceae bacterium]
MDKAEEIKKYIRTIPDFPVEGVQFRDITTVIGDGKGFKLAIDAMSELVKDLDFDVIAGAESRGFIFGAPSAYNEGKPFVLIRKKGKLPWKTVEESYALEYGTATLEMHVDSIKPGDRVLIVDDLIATGGTTEAMIKLVEKLGGTVAGVLVLIELPALKGREQLGNVPLYSVLSFDGE